MTGTQSQLIWYRLAVFHGHWFLFGLLYHIVSRKGAYEMQKNNKKETHELLQNYSFDHNAYQNQLFNC